MSDIILYGDARSTYVRTARLVCEEKGISYGLEPADLGSEGYRALHPFARMPAMRQGDFLLYETGAIARYLDATFDGASLQPADPRQRARMDQWISVACDYCYEQMVRRFVIQYVFPSGPGGQPNRAIIDAAVPEIRYQLSVLDRALRDRSTLAGDKLSLAELFLGPILFYVGKMPEGGELMGAAPHVRRMMEALEARRSFAATLPPMG